MRRELILKSDPAPHAFRASFRHRPDFAAVVRTSLSDRQLFTMTFIAGFLAFYGFIA